MAFGPTYTYMLLRLVYGQRWSETEAPRALAVYCLYILLLAVNGILEAFVHAVANSRCAYTFLLLPCACALPWLMQDIPGREAVRPLTQWCQVITWPQAVPSAEASVSLGCLC